ncbi:rCG49110, partial [Rattus norvegicus]
MIRMAQREQ